MVPVVMSVGVSVRVLENAICSKRKSSVFCRKKLPFGPNSTSSAEQFVRTEHTFGRSLVQWGFCWVLGCCTQSCTLVPQLITNDPFLL